MTGYEKSRNYRITVSLRGMRAESVITLQTSAIKDIINAADNGEPYSAEELKRIFLQDYQLGYDYLKRFRIEEIS
jgi:hypothetical protein